MASSSGLLLAATMLAVLISLASASTFHVGGSDGWTSGKNVNYTKWADSIHFQVGDFLRFEYDNKSENVLRVSQHHFAACNVSEPMKRLTSGNDSFLLHRAGHFFFISSVDGKCAGKAKLNVKVYANDEGNAPKVAPASLVPAPAPKAAAAALTVKDSVGSVVLAALLLISASF